MFYEYVGCQNIMGQINLSFEAARMCYFHQMVRFCTVYQVFAKHM